MMCDKCNIPLKAIPGPQYKNAKGQLYRVLLLKCCSCNTWKQEIEYIKHEKINGVIETTYRIAK